MTMLPGGMRGMKHLREKPIAVFGVRATLVVLALSTLWSSSARAQGWYSSSWPYRKQITIDFTKVGATGAPHANLPVLVSLSADANLSANARADGFDIVFTSSDGTTKLNHERTSYASGTLLAWVQVPSVSATANTVIYMYYGNASAADQQNGTGTWDANYVGVWHLNETVGGAGAIKDATSNAKHGTTNGTMTLGSAGAIGKGIAFTNGWVDFGTSTTFNFGNGAYTAELWAKGGGGNQSLFSKGTFLGGTSYGFHWQNAGTYLTWAGSKTIGAYNASWHSVVVTRAGTGANQMLTFYDGGPGTTATSTDAINFTSAAPLIIGDASDHANHFTGSIDEVRLSKTVRSTGWIATEYNNENSPSTFYSVGAQVASTVVTVLIEPATLTLTSCSP